MSAVQQTMQEILFRLKQRPISIFFTVDLEEAGLVDPAYQELVSKPMDLTKVQNNLEAGQYTTIQQFRDDLNLIWTNITRYFGETTYFGICAEEMKLYADKLINRSLLFTWCELVTQKKQKLYELLAEPPQDPKKEECGLDFTRPLPPQLLTLDDMRWIDKAVHKLATAIEQKQILSIVAEHQPELIGATNVAEVDMTKLKPATIRHLKGYLSERLEFHGVKI